MQLNHDALIQMAVRITMLAQTYGVDQLVNRSGTMYWGGGMLSSTVLLTFWHNVSISIYLQFTTHHIQLPVEKNYVINEHPL